MRSRARSTTRTVGRVPATAAAALLVLAVAGCGGQDEVRPESVDSPVPQQSSLPPVPGSSPSEGATGTSPAASGTSSSASSGTSTTLTGSVGTADDPDAFVITLVDADGQDVTELPAGDYTIQVDDRSTIHNFHLVGDGVEETTTVPEVTTTTWDVTLEPGDYTFRCDPHPNMVGELTVT